MKEAEPLLISPIVDIGVVDINEVIKPKIIRPKKSIWRRNAPRILPKDVPLKKVA